MKNKDRPAFPLEREDDGQYDVNFVIGLTKHEEFAKAAMQGLISTGSYNNPKELKETAEKMADLMLEEKDSEQ